MLVSLFREKLQRIMKKKLLFIISVLVLSPLFLFGNTTKESVPEDKGVLKGVVTDAVTGEPLIGVSVFIPGTIIGGTTDFDGNFFIEVEPGKYTLKMSYIGYQDVYIRDLILDRGKALNIQQRLIEDSQMLGEVEIVAKMSRNSEVSAILVQQNSVIMLENIAADELSRKGISNVEEGLTKVAGISKQATRGIVVRGLGDRYNNVLINGLPMPSLDPDMKSLPLSMFPTSVIKTLSINKSYLGKLYGDFAGATVDIETKDTPRNAFFDISLSSGINSYYAKGDNQKLDDKGVTGMWGLQKKRRDLPRYMYALSQAGYYYKEFPYPFINTSAITNLKGSELFDTKFNPDVRSAPIDFGLAVAGGKTFELSDGVALGFVATANFSSDNDKEEGITKILNVVGDERKSFKYVEWAYNTKLNALLALTLDINQKHRLTFNNLYLNNAKNSINEKFGDDYDSGINELFLRRSKYVQNDLYNGQLLGNHRLDDDYRLFLDWGVSFSYVESDEPDTKDIGIIGTGASAKYIQDTGDNGGRYFSEMKESQYAARVALRYGFEKTDAGQNPFRNYLNIGYNMSLRDRDFFQLSMAFNKKSALTKGLDYTVDTEKPDAFLNKVLDSGAFYYQELRQPEGRDFEANQRVHAAYLSFERNFTDKLTAVFDIRAEQTDRTIKYVEVVNSIFDPFTEQKYNPLDILPGLNLNYKVNDETNIRFALSKTVTRPGFRETTKSVYRIPGIGEVQGNPKLVNSDNFNADLKFEIFPDRGEMFAVNAFYKYIQDPIERIAAPSASGRNFTFANVKDATVYGIELELIKNMGNLFKSEILKPFTLGLNTTLMKSEVNIDKKKTAFLTNAKRELQGASPYLVNADITYDKHITKVWLSKATLTYNVFGERIYAVGGNNIGDFVEKPQHTIDFIWNNVINRHWTVSLSIKDILNTDFKVEQEGVKEGKNAITDMYNNGMNFSIKVGYKF